MPMKSWPLAAMIVLQLSSGGCGGEIQDSVSSKEMKGTITQSPIHLGSGTHYGSVNLGWNYDQPRNMTNPDVYAPHSYQPSTLLFSENVTDVSFRFDTFETGVDGAHTPPTYKDYLRVYDENGYNYFYGNALHHQSSKPAPYPNYEPFETRRGSATPYLSLVWWSNTTEYDFNYWGDPNAFKGFHVNRFKIQTNEAPVSSVTNRTWVTANEPVDGYLLGTGDVIYVKVTQKANSDMSFLIWPYGENRNFHMYVSSDPSITKPDYYDVNWSTVRAHYPIVSTPSPGLVVFPKT